MDEYSYPLEDARIAKFPLAERDASKLLLYKKGEISETVFRSLGDYLPQNALLVRNNTRVIQARMFFYKESGACIELFCLEPHCPSDYALAFQQTSTCEWVCMVGHLKKWKSGKLTHTLQLHSKEVIVSAERLSGHDFAHIIRFEWNSQELTFADILEQTGQLPIPPYLNRETQESDKESYQTVYAKIDGSVAAPTAGLHFTGAVLADLKRRGISIAEVTLHVGAGTFQPVKSEQIGNHQMHEEVISVQRSVIELIRNHPETIIAVGTTSVRTLESLYFIGRQLIVNNGISDFSVMQWEPYHAAYFPTVEESLDAILDYLQKHDLQQLNASTQIIIAPGYSFQLVKGIITNFHQPRSTLLLLIAAFVGNDWRKIYDYALQHDFRFLSYGDSSLLLGVSGERKENEKLNE